MTNVYDIIFIDRCQKTHRGSSITILSVEENMSPALIGIGFVLVLICAATLYLFLKAFYEKKQVHALIFKGISSLCFIIIGAMTCFSGQVSLSGILIFIGLCFGLVGDEVIHLCQIYPKHDSLAFIGGGSFFLVGHILYIPALLLLGEVSWISVAIAFILMFGGGLVYERQRRFLRNEMKVPLALYLGIVTLMGAVAIGVFVMRGSLGTALFAIGGMLFPLSDNILFAYKLGEKPKFVQNVALHLAYYIAQILIAWSIAWL
jgi:uncharacterized membrane protein YhhN